VLLSGGLTAALGLAAGTLTPACVPFDVGSTLIAYTDGLVEPRGRTLDEGVAALAAECRALPSDPQQSAAALVRQLLIVAPTGNAWRNDDVTVVAVRRS
jgi:serine phosphatase RsbU (regulator of sigma subunit)